MMFMEIKTILNSFLSNSINKMDRSYLLEPNVFVRNRKLSFKDTVLYILCNKGRTTSLLKLLDSFMINYGIMI